MPGEPNAGKESREPIPSTDAWKPPPELVARLQPWVDLDQLGPSGLHRWIERILPLLPSPSPSRRSPRAEPAERIRELSQALAAAAGEEARAHFQAAVYFRENQVLTRRLLALEAALRSRGPPAEDHTPDVEAALDRYLPRKEKP